MMVYLESGRLCALLKAISGHNFVERRNRDGYMTPDFFVNSARW